MAVLCKFNGFNGSMLIKPAVTVIFADDLVKAKDAYKALNEELEGTLKDLGGM